MSDHDTTIPPETDDELRARLRAFAQDVKERTDTEAALGRMPRRSRPPTIGLLAIAACLLGAVALAAIVAADRQSVETTDPSNSPTQTTAATGPRTLAHGEDIELVGGIESGLGNQNLDIDAVEENGEVTGEFRITDQSGTQPPNVFTLECARTNPDDGIVMLGGSATDGGLDWPEGFMMAMTIIEGDPDRVSIGGDDSGEKSCIELLESIPDDPDEHPESGFVDVEDGSDIETG